MYQPLADELRPDSLDDVVGQEHILGEGALLRRLIDSGSIPNLIFYGPSGTGKTTVANIIAAKTKRKLCRLNATTASSADIREIAAQPDTLLAPEGVLLYLDEIQYFTKKQQQSLLEHIENGKITLIASTTENPYFYVYGAILSRSSVFEFRAVTPEAAAKAAARAVRIRAEQLHLRAELEPGVLEDIGYGCGGDVRKAMNAVELLFSASRVQDGVIRLTRADAEQTAQRSAMRYDRDGDAHYDLLSALQKSIRGSDPDAAVHYLARILEAGDLPSVCRRLLVIAAEDIGLAYPQAIPVVKACVDSALQLGMPEARIPLGDAAVLLATAPKSNSGHVALDLALEDVRKGRTGPIPRHLQNKHCDSAGQEREQGYCYPHDAPGHWVRQQYLPDALVGTQYYTYGDNRTEQAARQYWEKIKK